MLEIKSKFEWDFNKEADNIRKHGLDFTDAQEVFADPKVIYLENPSHSDEEDRFYAIGRIYDGRIITVRFTLRDDSIRIIGAAEWRKWRKYYEKNSRPK